MADTPNIHTPQSILMRAHNGPSVGIGHMMRCFALARAFAGAETDIHMLISYPAPELTTHFESLKIKTHILPIKAGNDAGTDADIDAVLSMAEKHAADWVILDGYCFGSRFHKAIRDRGIRLLVLDDTAHLPAYHADLVLNQNIHAEKSLYPHTDPDTRLLLGPAYILLGDAFLSHPQHQRHISDNVHNILVSMGGSDPRNHIPTIVNVLNRIKAPNLRLTIVAGPANPNIADVRAAAGASHHHVTLLRHTQAMQDLMAQADLAISASGSSAWELAYMGLPGILIAAAENQVPVGQHLMNAGAALFLNPEGPLDPEEIVSAFEKLANAPEYRREMSGLGMRLVDGKGARRVRKAMQVPRFCIRPVVDADSRAIWQLANEPTVRAASFSTAAIPWESHRKWYRDKLTDPCCKYFVAESHDQTLLGQIRFDITDQDAFISVSIAPEYRAMGLGPDLIARTTETLFESVPVRQVHARVKTNNPASMRAFVKAGYAHEGTGDVNGQEAFYLLKRKGSCHAEIH